MPAPTSRPPALTAVWGGVATALVAAVSGIVAVAVVWLPASGSSGGAGSTIRAGILTFLAGVHGGVTVDGLPTAFVPLGLTVGIGVLAWRATTAVVDTADAAGETRPGVLLRALAAQSGAFALMCAILAATASLGTSSASTAGSFVAGFALTALVGGAALLRRTALGDELRAIAPAWLAPAARCAVAVVGVQLAAGALLVAGSLVVHHNQVLTLSREVGGGWSSVPVLLLGVLAAPNAVIAGAGYLSGAGFAVGSGTSVGLTSTTTGVVPAFPLLGALPGGGGASLPGWLLAAVTPVLAGLCVAAIAGRAGSEAERWRDAALGVAGASVVGAALAWQGGGAVGSGRLRAVGASPWQYALATAVGTGAVAAVLIGSRVLLEALQHHEVENRPSLRATVAGLTTIERHGDGDGVLDADDPVSADRIADHPVAADFETDDFETDDSAGEDSAGRTPRAG